MGLQLFVIKNFLWHNKVQLESCLKSVNYPLLSQDVSDVVIRNPIVVFSIKVIESMDSKPLKLSRSQVFYTLGFFLKCCTSKREIGIVATSF